MANRYRPIPDWFSFENEGAGVAVADLTGTGAQDLVVLAVDNPDGQNRGVYRVGRALNDAGDVTGGWTPWIDVPDWFSFENQGAGVAVADVDGDGRLDLIVFMIDAPGEQNRGVYRVGKRLGADGVVEGGWGPWIDVPDWFSFENQHGGIAVADLDGDGRAELVVFMVDNPEGQNRGVYRIGRRLDGDGNVTGGWTPWIDVPDWFSWENQGAGVTLVQRDGQPPDLVVFQIDGAFEQNQAFFKYGHGLQATGEVADWTLWHGVPEWTSWENQGGGIAAFRQGGKPRLLVLDVDNPPNQNAGLYQVIPIDDDPSRDGQWELLPYHSGVLAVHAALMPKGKVVFFAGSASSQTRFDAPDFGDIANGVPTSVVWNPTAEAAPGDFTEPSTLVAANHRPYDYFCAGQTHLSDGRLLTAGGTGHYNPYLGRNESVAFDPIAGTWSFLKPMAHGRWYPTLITLGDGKVLAATGLSEVENQHNPTIEIYDPVANTWKVKHFPGGFPGLPLYAHLFLLGDGRVFFDGGRMDDELEVDPCVIDLGHEPMGTQVVPGLAGNGMRNQSASVLLPPAQDQRVMIMGGGPAGKPNKTDAIDDVDIVDWKGPQPQFVAAAPLCFPRLHLNSVLLPDRTVLVTGGSLKQEDAPLARLQPEIYDPATDTWTPLAASTVPRLYHSTALLLPDGRVVSAGGNPEAGDHVQWDQDPEEEMRLEIFSPPYLFRGARPTIARAPTDCAHGQVIDVDTPDAARVKWVSLVSPGSTTHSFDTHQRLVDAPIAARAAGKISATIPANANVAPPGFYMLFLVDDAGVPSVASWLRIV